MGMTSTSISLSPEAQQRVPLIVCCLKAFSSPDSREESSLDDYRKVAAALVTLKDNRFYSDLLKQAAREDAGHGIETAARGIIAEKIAQMLPSYDRSEHKSDLKLAAGYLLGCIVNDINSSLFKTGPEDITRTVKFLAYHVGSMGELTELLRSEYARLGSMEAK
jgi:hypothetical protein